MEGNTHDELMQLKAHVKQLTQQLVEQEAREHRLKEEKAYLEEQAQLASEMQAQVKQHIFERKAREKILVEQNARLEERVRLSRDLHDSVKQHVFALAVQIELARSRLNQDHGPVLEHLNEADQLSYQIQQELSALIDALRPLGLQAKALTTALRDYLATWSRQTQITVDLSLPQACLLPSTIEEALWRVVQEALSNVARHSQGNQMKLCLEWTAQQVTLTLADNGKGFDPHAASQKGMGLSSIRERIEQVGGTLWIHSVQGEGAQMVICCPLPGLSDNAPAEDEVSG